MWTTLTSEYIPGLRLEIRPRVITEGEAYIQVEVVDDSLVTDNGSQMVNVWAQREFRSGINLISVGQLFDLLIVAHRAIDAYFELGEAVRPPRRAK